MNISDNWVPRDTVIRDNISFIYMWIFFSLQKKFEIYRLILKISNIKD